ncbi:MAG: hypothetical protein K2P81_12175 [Bacteriovoracaceae bacterium]|nr:hypothetical protein [Bacteriovoracaceae bacterium]
MRFALLLWLMTFSALAFEAPVGVRSPRGLLMGDAWTAVNNDEYTLFYNPASLGRHSHDLTMYPFNPQINGPNVLSDLKKFQDMPSTPTGVADVIMDYPVHLGTSLVPGVKLFNFGFSYIASESADLLLRNKIHPTLDVDYRSDRGFATGFAIPLGPGRISGKSISGTQTNLGVGAKYIKRRGLYDSYALTGTDLLDYINSNSDTNDIINQLGLVQGDAWGFDAGVEHVVREGPNQWVFGLAALDIGGTKFNVASNPNKKVVANNKDQVNLGAAWLYRTALFRGTFSLDIRGLTQEMEMLERLRTGFEIGIPGISFLGGINSGYYSYGLGLDLGVMKLTAGFYGLEVGGAYNRTQSKRFVIYLSLFDFSFDA